jgi:hypothetical protein
MIAKKDHNKKVSLTEERLAEFALFRRNLRLLRAVTGLSAEALFGRMVCSINNRRTNLFFSHP